MEHNPSKTKKGYDCSQVDTVISEIDLKVQELKEEEKSISEIMINANLSADEIKKKASEEARNIIDNANLDAKQILDEAEEHAGDAVPGYADIISEMKENAKVLKEEQADNADIPLLPPEQVLVGPEEMNALTSELPLYMDKYFIKRQRLKIVSTLLQIILFLLVCTVIYFVFISRPSYEQEAKSLWTQRDGFIALSYVGIAKSSHGTLVSKSVLEEQLTALKSAGYVTINNEDIINFYEHGSALPEKALYLMFEDGRKDNVLLAQPILEKLNFCANFFTYADNVANKDEFFLKGSKIESIGKKGYWDFGLNGNKFQYINVRQAETEEAVSTAQAESMSEKKTDKMYDFFLTNYVYDEDDNLIETYDEMKARIEDDYDTAINVFTKESNVYPDAYVFMSSNKMFNNVPADVESVNLGKIEEYYKLMFNRDTTCYNSADTDIYDLRRMIVQPEWSTNRLIMEIENCYPTQVPFVMSDAGNLSAFETVSGVINADTERLILTAPYGARALTRFTESETWKDVRVSVDFMDNRDGTQNLYLRYKSNDSFIRLSMNDNKFTVSVKEPGAEIVNLFSSVLPGSYMINDLRDRFNIEQIASQKAKTEQERAEETFGNLTVGNNAPFQLEASDKTTLVWWPVEAVLIGNRLAVKVNGVQIAESFYIDHSVSDGSFAFECFGNDFTAYDGYYRNLKMEPLAPVFAEYNDAGEVDNAESGVYEFASLPNALGAEEEDSAEGVNDVALKLDADGRVVYYPLPKGEYALEIDGVSLPRANAVGNKLINDNNLVAEEILLAENEAAKKLAAEKKAESGAAPQENPEENLESIVGGLADAGVERGGEEEYSGSLENSFDYFGKREYLDVLSGIVISPKASEMEKAKETAEKARALGYKAGLMLDEGSAEAFAAYEGDIYADWLAIKLDSAESAQQQKTLAGAEKKFDRERIFIQLPDETAFTPLYVPEEMKITYDAEEYSQKTALEKMRDIIYLLRDKIVVW